MSLLLRSHYNIVSILITGDRNKGWYYGENVRTGKRGWFPLAYTEQVKDADVDSGYIHTSRSSSSFDYYLFECCSKNVPSLRANENFLLSESAKSTCSTQKY